MIKKLTLTEDLVKLIKNIKFEAFENGELFSTSKIHDAIVEIESDPEAQKKFGKVRDALVRAEEKLNIVSYQKDCYAWGINQWALFGGTYVMEDIALIIGRYEDYIKGTEESPQGREYPKELKEYMWGLYNTLVDNMEYIISLVLYYSDKGGISPGTYKCKDTLKEWVKID